MIGSNATVVRVRRTPSETDLYGNPDPDATEGRLAIADAFTAPRTSADITDPGRMGVVVGLDLYAPFDVDIVHTDQIEVDGVLYDVDGETAQWRQPMTGWEAGCVVALVRAAG